MNGKTHRSSLFWKIAATVVLVGTLIATVYVMIKGIGLQDELDFGAGAYYYADIPSFEKYLAWDAFKPALPYVVYVLIFLAWGALMYGLWKWVDKKR